MTKTDRREKVKTLVGICKCLLCYRKPYLVCVTSLKLQTFFTPRITALTTRMKMRIHFQLEGLINSEQWRHRETYGNEIPHQFTNILLLS